MSDWFAVDLREMFSFHRAPLDLVIRTTLVYLSICVLLRVVPKRQAGKLSPNDLIVLILLGGIATTALELAPMSVSDVLLVTLTILAWNLALDWLAFRFPLVRRVIQEPPTRLIQDGKILTRNLRRELITLEEVQAQLRMQDIHDIEDVKLACLEVDGTISVVKENGRRPVPLQTTDPETTNDDTDEESRS